MHVLGLAMEYWLLRYIDGQAPIAIAQGHKCASPRLISRQFRVEVNERGAFQSGSEGHQFGFSQAGTEVGRLSELESLGRHLIPE